MTPPYSLSRGISAVMVPSKLSSWRCSLDQRWGLVELCGHYLGRLYGRSGTALGAALGAALGVLWELFGKNVDGFGDRFEQCFKHCFGKHW